MSSAYFTGVGINTNITEAQMGLRGSSSEVSSPVLKQKIQVLNNNAVSLLMNFINFKDKVLLDMVSCNIFTRNYPAMLVHVIEEGKFYLRMIQKIQKCEEIVSVHKSYALEGLWNQNMEEHGAIISLLLDPTEKQLVDGAKSFAEEFKTLSSGMKKMKDKVEIDKTCQTIILTREIRDFKKKIAQGILECEIKSIMIPLLADHVLREANHYLRILEDIR